MVRFRTALLTASAIVMGLTSVVHVFIGGPEINAPVQASSLPPEVRATMAVVWHMITALLVFFTLATLTLLRRDNRALAVSVFGLEAVFALLFLGVGIYSFASILVLPQWIAFALGAALLLPAVTNLTK